nr:hypothetical protein fge_16_PS366H01_c1_72547 [Paspalum simplex]
MPSGVTQANPSAGGGPCPRDGGGMATTRRGELDKAGGVHTPIPRGGDSMGMGGRGGDAMGWVVTAVVPQGWVAVATE